MTENYAANNYGTYPSLDQLKPTLSPDIQAKVGANLPTAANATAIGYSICGGTGADISYFDSMTNSLMHITAGSCG